VNVEQARFNMVEQQVRTWEVLDQKVLALIERAPRHQFVPESYRGLAYADIGIPLAHDQAMMAPRMEARILQVLQLHSRDRVLEVGTGSGYLTHLLAALAGHVFSVEIHDDLLQQARERLQAAGTFNVTLECADGAAGRPQDAPYDAIVLTGSVLHLPEAFAQQLCVGGRLFAVVGEAPAMVARLITRVAPDQCATEELFETVLPPLGGIPQVQPFVF